MKGWKGSSSWGFPKGKKNKDEEDMNCAVREVTHFPRLNWFHRYRLWFHSIMKFHQVFEETGFDISGRVKRDDYLELVIFGQQRCRLFVVHGVPENSKFEPRTKKEISVRCL